MAKPVSISSQAEFTQLLGSSNVVIADFYADWCGPCKAIAPVYESLCAQYSKPKAVTFTKINVDSQSALASQYGVRAMPTFLIFKSGSVINTIKGADRGALTSAVAAAARDAKGANPLAAQGHRLGGDSVSGGPVPPARRQAMFGRPIGTIIIDFINALFRVIGLYLVTLFSFDPYKSAESSAFNANAEEKRAKARLVGGQRTLGGGRPLPQGQSATASAASERARRYATLSDLRKDQ